MVYEISVDPSVADQRFQVVLGGATYDLRVRWNETAGQWFLDVGDSAGFIIHGSPLALGVPLLEARASRRLPAGEFVLLDTSGADEEPGLADLGARVKLMFVEG